MIDENCVFYVFWARKEKRVKGSLGTQSQAKDTEKFGKMQGKGRKIYGKNLTSIKGFL